MLQHTKEKIMFLLYLFITAFISTHAANTSTVFKHCCKNGDDNEKIYHALDAAEQLIKSAKIMSTKTSQPMDCEDLLRDGQNKSGVYLVWPKSRIISGSISVYCDMETDGGGWTVIQRRGDFNRTTDYFYQDWHNYKRGFGSLKEDFWLGNDNIYALTNQRTYTIRFDLGSFIGNKAYAVYNNFWIDDDYNNYRMHVAGYKGNAGDSFSSQNDMKFSTKDRKNDISRSHCAQEFRASWWFRDCHLANLNGIYHRGKTPKEWEGIIWWKWKGSWESLATTEIKIRSTPSWIK